MTHKKHSPNRLIRETSPYLLQHAYNPVDWHPWNEQTLKLAIENEKMILVSIGYSACHWCHVMEHESFEDEEVARLMNEHFICIKVDREERPDVDHLFMEAVQLITGQGGWPLNCFALPDGRPIWGGTYFRKHHWLQVLQHFAEMWERRDPALQHQAENVQIGLIDRLSVNIDTQPYESGPIFQQMARIMLRQSDSRLGGRSGAPKFPMPDLLLFQWLLAQRLPDEGLRNHVLLTLDRMVRGGIFDQLEGGFARYSVDERWHVPHFEKMLYDNAQLIGLYAEVAMRTDQRDYEAIVRQTIHWCLSDLYKPGEMFCSALDADSEGEEGRFYVWTQKDFEALPAELVSLLAEWYGIGGQAVWEHDKNVLVRPNDIKAFCQKHQLDEVRWQSLLNRGNQTLLDIRRKRIRPGLDDKQLLSWNALMVKGLCSAFRAFGHAEWLQIAKDVVSFIQKKMKTPDGGLLRSYKNGEARIPAFLDDYAFYIQALTSLYQCTFEEEYLFEARRLADYTLKHFFNADRDFFSYTSHASNDLVVKPREFYDNVIPSSNAAMCLAMSILGIYFEDDHLLNLAGRMIRNQASLMAQYPSGFSHWGQAMWLYEHQEITVFRGADAVEYAQGRLRQLPQLHSLAASDGSAAIPAVASKPFQEGLWRWKCDNNGCGLPERLQH